MTEKRDIEPAPGRDLKLMACDDEDLAVLSAHLQDAILRVGDMAYLKHERRFVLVLQRFDWLASAGGAPQRAQTGLHFEHVRTVALQGFRQDRPDDLLNLLNIEFFPGEAPAGEARLIFSGGCAIRLELECMEARMADLGPRWRVRHAPGHGGGAFSGA
ncbi:DUF2948 family protein [Rhodoblastus sp.]|jgi:hypothetical protein|uniref:DUF2948 family protein n=1 Tax=Rhodoblastus sp. TaxID=1962975 RepID=UPI002626E314|nr:DUF2948 family protein [Rhodoblastus sp.]